MDSDNPHMIFPVKGGATSLVYCITGSDQQYMAAADSQGKIEVLRHCLAYSIIRATCVLLILCAYVLIEQLVIVSFFF